MGFKWDETKKALDESKKSGKRTRRFQIKDGESVPIRFLVNDNEPLIYKRHYDSRTSRYIVCAEDLVRDGKHDGCVACYVAKQDGKSGRLRNAARVFAFSVYDPRKFHFVEANPDKEKYQNCKDDPTCKWCRKGIEVRTNGVSHWSLSGATTEQLQTFEKDLLGSKCAVCQLGTIKVKAYVCPDCGEPLDVDDPNEEYRCYECGPGKKVIMVKPKEIVICTRGCEKARRTSLTDAWVIVTRSGEGTSTTYNFSPGEINRFDVESAVPMDLAKMDDYIPLPAPEMAAALGVRNPYKKGDAPDPANPDDDDVPFNKATGVTADEDDADANVFRR